MFLTEADYYAKMGIDMSNTFEIDSEIEFVNTAIGSSLICSSINYCFETNGGLVIHSYDAGGIYLPDDTIDSYVSIRGMKEVLGIESIILFNDVMATETPKKNRFSFVSFDDFTTEIALSFIDDDSLEIVHETRKGWI